MFSLKIMWPPEPCPYHWEQWDVSVHCLKVLAIKPLAPPPSMHSQPQSTSEKLLSDFIPTHLFPTWCPQIFFLLCPAQKVLLLSPHGLCLPLPLKIGFQPRALIGVGAIPEFLHRWYLGACKVGVGWDVETSRLIKTLFIIQALSIKSFLFVYHSSPWLWEWGPMGVLVVELLKPSFAFFGCSTQGGAVPPLRSHWRKKWKKMVLSGLISEWSSYQKNSSFSC